jgi:hypothetical protein
MAAISFSSQRAWVKDRWAVSRVLYDMLLVCPDDLKAVLEQSLVLDGVAFDLLEESAASRLMGVLRDVVARTLNESKGSVLTWKLGLNEHAQSQYKEAIRELKEMMGPEPAVLFSAFSG